MTTSLAYFLGHYTLRMKSCYRFCFFQLRAHQLATVDYQKQMKNAITAKGETKHPKFSKLAKFFGEQPPLLHLFLKQLGYEVRRVQTLHTRLLDPL